MFSLDITYLDLGERQHVRGRRQVADDVAHDRLRSVGRRQAHAERGNVREGLLVVGVGLARLVRILGEGVSVLVEVGHLDVRVRSPHGH